MLHRVEPAPYHPLRGLLYRSTAPLNSSSFDAPGKVANTISFHDLLRKEAGARRSFMAELREPKRKSWCPVLIVIK
jgi:hypothetical protein